MHTLIGVDPDVTHREGDDDGHIILEASAGSSPDVRAGKTREVFPLPRGKEREREREAQKVGQKNIFQTRERRFIYGLKLL